jgi:hypothetical protein
MTADPQQKFSHYCIYVGVFIVHRFQDAEAARFEPETATFADVRHFIGPSRFRGPMEFSK